MKHAIPRVVEVGELCYSSDLVYTRRAYVRARKNFNAERRKIGFRLARLRWDWMGLGGKNAEVAVTTRAYRRSTPRSER